MATTKFPYDFPSEEVKMNFKLEAMKKDITIVDMITEALKKHYPQLFKTKK